MPMLYWALQLDEPIKYLNITEKYDEIANQSNLI